eukprot:scaffold97632_cov35-Tisochrysis_lutea.AAC.1
MLHGTHVAQTIASRNEAGLANTSALRRLELRFFKASARGAAPIALADLQVVVDGCSPSSEAPLRLGKLRRRGRSRERCKCSRSERDHAFQADAVSGRGLLEEAAIAGTLRDSRWWRRCLGPDDRAAGGRCG